MCCVYLSHLGILYSPLSKNEYTLLCVPGISIAYTYDYRDYWITVPYPCTHIFLMNVTVVSNDLMALRSGVVHGVGRLPAFSRNFQLVLYYDHLAAVWTNELKGIEQKWFFLSRLLQLLRREIAPIYFRQHFWDKIDSRADAATASYLNSVNKSEISWASTNYLWRIAHRRVWLNIFRVNHESLATFPRITP